MENLQEKIKELNSYLTTSEREFEDLFMEIGLKENFVYKWLEITGKDKTTLRLEVLTQDKDSFSFIGIARLISASGQCIGSSDELNNFDNFVIRDTEYTFINDNFYMEPFDD